MRKKSVAHELCSCGKRGFADEHDADKALGRARAKRERAFAAKPTRRGMDRENRYYACEYGDLFHLTGQSRREFLVVAG